MRTIAAVALALTMLFTVAGANATTHKKKHHHSSTTKGDTTKDAPKPTKEKAPATK